MLGIRFWKKGKASANERIGIAFGMQEVLAVRVKAPFSDHPRIEGCVHHSQVTDESWPKVFADIAKGLGAEGRSVVVTLNAQQTNLIQLSLPEVPAEEMANALKFRAREFSSIPIEDMVIDYIEIQGMRARGSERIGYCAVARLSQMRALRDAILSSGMHLEAIDIRDMVLRYIMPRGHGDTSDNAAFLFIDQEDARVIVAGEKRFYIFRSSNMGAKLLQKTLSEQGESGIIRLSEALVLEIQRTLDFYESNFTDPPPRHVLIAPNLSFLTDIAHHIQGQLRLPLHLIRLEEHIEGIDKLEGVHPSLAALALGAALRPRNEGSG